MSDRRQLAKRFAHEIVDAHPENYKPGMVCVVIVNEVEAAEGALEIDASTECAASKLVPPPSDADLAWIAANDWAEVIVQTSAFRHVWHSAQCIGWTMTSHGRAWCGACGWGLSARLQDVGGIGSACFAYAAIARIGEALERARIELVQALFEAVLP